MSKTVIPYTIPYTCQFASRDRVREFVAERRLLLSDGLWADYGADSPNEYAHWSLRSCGVVCVKMVIEGLGGERRSVMDYVHEGLAIEGYLTTIRDDRPDQIVEIGWKHSALAQLIRNAGYDARLIAEIGLDDICAHLEAGGILIGSVTSQLGEVGVEPTRQSGHLVVVVGFSLDESEEVESVIIHNPSGRTRRLQESAPIPVERFMAGFSGRGIVIEKPSALNENPS